jgi:hypothetical protein
MSLSSASRARVDGDAPHVVLTGHHHLDEPGAGHTLDFHLRQFVLCALEVVLHLLGLLHQARELLFHHVGIS